MERYEQVPHTADIAARVFGETVPGLFENAAFAMFDIMADLGGLDADTVVKVELEAPDTESLLVAWLNELLYRSYLKQVLFFDFQIIALENNTLQAEARGRKMPDRRERMRTEIKATTYHALEIKKTGPGYEVTVVFDV